ncbi:MAG: InlB B-repeat-containing protein [Christensenellales bacterium]
MKLTAVWEARSFTVTYVLLNGETRTETAAYGKTVTLVEEPRTGYTFVGWKDSEKVYHAGETITVTGDMTLTAEWKKLPSAENLPKTGDESPVLLWARRWRFPRRPASCSDAGSKSETMGRKRKFCV